MKLMAVRRFQSQMGRLPEALRSVAIAIMEHGHAVDLGDRHRKARNGVGLPEVPPTVLARPEMMEEIQAIVRAREFAKFVEKGGDE